MIGFSILHSALAFVWDWHIFLWIAWIPFNRRWKDSIEIVSAVANKPIKTKRYSQSRYSMETICMVCFDWIFHCIDKMHRMGIYPKLCVFKSNLTTDVCMNIRCMHSIQWMHNCLIIFFFFHSICIMFASLLLLARSTSIHLPGAINLIISSATDIYCYRLFLKIQIQYLSSNEWMSYKQRPMHTIDVAGR